MPLRVAQMFTYRLPALLRAEARVGARVLVPLGRKLVTAYIVALHTSLDPALELTDEEIKEAEELLDTEPLLTPEVLELTRWLADYFAHAFPFAKYDLVLIPELAYGGMEHAGATFQCRERVGFSIAARDFDQRVFFSAAL